MPEPNEVNEVVEGVEQTTDAPVQDETLQAAINARVDELVLAELNRRLTGVTPKRNVTDDSKAEQAAFKKMSYKERLKIFQADPAAYNKLNGGNA